MFQLCLHLRNMRWVLNKKEPGVFLSAYRETEIKLESWPGGGWLSRLNMMNFKLFLLLLFLFLLWILNVLLSADCSITGAEELVGKNKDFVVADFTVLITTEQIIYSVLPSAVNLAPERMMCYHLGP